GVLRGGDGGGGGGCPDGVAVGARAAAHSSRERTGRGDRSTAGAVPAAGRGARARRGRPPCRASLARPPPAVAGLHGRDARAVRKSGGGGRGGPRPPGRGWGAAPCRGGTSARGPP